MAPPTSFKKIPPTSSADVEEKLNDLWTQSINAIVAIEPGTTNWKQQVLPLARIKKIMKSDEAVYAEIEREHTTTTSDATTLASNNNSRFMIASEAPILLGKACELLVKEITIRSWRHTERNRRRTLQKQDVHTAVGESEVYDFLIDIVPRVPLVGKSFVPPDTALATASSAGAGGVINASSDVQSQATAALEQAMANQQVQETNAAQAQMQYNMMLQQHQQQMQAVEAAHAANATGAADASGVVNQQMPQQMMMYMPQISWQQQAIPQQQQHQQQQQISAAPMVHNAQHIKLQDIDNTTPDLQKS